MVISSVPEFSADATEAYVMIDADSTAAEIGKDVDLFIAYTSFFCISHAW